jgi:hypothetical protein
VQQLRERCEARLLHPGLLRLGGQHRLALPGLHLGLRRRGLPLDPQPLADEQGPDAITLYGRDFIRDTFFAAKDAADDAGGHSYEIRAWFFAGKYPDGTTILAAPGTSVGSQLGWSRLEAPEAFNLNTRNVIKTVANTHFPDKSYLAIDNDNDGSILPTIGRPDGVNNWPDAWNNHGRDGYTVSFADGHASFVKTGAGMVRMYLDAHDEPPVNYQNVSPYRQRSVVHRGVSIPEYFEP